MPPPRWHATRYFGVFAPASKVRPRIVRAGERPEGFPGEEDDGGAEDARIACELMGEHAPPLAAFASPPMPDGNGDCPGATCSPGYSGRTFCNAPAAAGEGLSPSSRARGKPARSSSDWASTPPRPRSRRRGRLRSRWRHSSHRRNMTASTRSTPTWRDHRTTRSERHRPTAPGMVYHRARRAGFSTACEQGKSGGRRWLRRRQTHAGRTEGRLNVLGAGNRRLVGTGEGKLLAWAVHLTFR